MNRLSIQPKSLRPNSSTCIGARGLRVRTDRCRTVARVSQVNQDQFEAEVLQSDKPVVVDFWSTWCGPCKLVAPLMDWAEQEYKGAIKVVKVEHDANPKLIEEYKVYGLPALVLIRDGKVVPGSKREGAFTKAIFVQWLSKHGITAPA